MARFFPATALGGRLHPHGISAWGPWDSRRLSPAPEAVVDQLLAVYATNGDRKVGTRQELLDALRESASRPSAITVWIAEEMEAVAQEVWQASSES